MQASSFGAVILLGNQHLWISAFRDYLHSCSPTITNPTHKRLSMTIYQTGGIDFVFPDVDLNEISEVGSATSKLKDFIQYKHYLNAHMLFFLNYMSPKFHQVLSFLSVAEIDTHLVSLSPGKWTETLYFEVCRELNLRTHIVRKKVMGTHEVKLIIRALLDDMNLETLLELFESTLLTEV